MTELVMLFLRYPAWAGEQAVTAAKRESPQFVPSVPQVELACEEAVKSTRNFVETQQVRDLRTRRQLEERAEIERQNELETPEHRRAVVAKLWPSGLLPEHNITNEIGAIPADPKKPGFRQFSADDLKKLYPLPADRPTEAEAAE